MRGAFQTMNSEVADDLLNSCTDDFPQSVDECLRLYEAIRHKYGMNIDTMPADARRIVQSLHSLNHRTTQKLADELYGEETHFLLEIVQNADDNAYADNITPELTMLLSDDQIRFENNEVGFMKSNLVSLCGMAQSSKRAQSSGQVTPKRSDHIGHKGIGFKSVFKVTQSPQIHSGLFHFCFDNTQSGMGYVMPRPLDEPADWKLLPNPITRIDLPFTDSASGALAASKKVDLRRSLADNLKQIDPSLLLFLHRLRCLRVQIRCSDVTFNRTMQRKDVHPLLVELKNDPLPSHLWLCFKEVLNVPDDIRLSSRNRQDAKQTEIALAFLLPTSESPPTARPVFAFLPLRSYGLSFVVQADWEVPSNREAIDESSKWNKWLLQQLPNLVSSTVEALLSEREQFVQGATRSAISHFVSNLQQYGRNIFDTDSLYGTIDVNHDEDPTAIAHADEPQWQDDDGKVARKTRTLAHHSASTDVTTDVSSWNLHLQAVRRNRQELGLSFWHFLLRNLLVYDSVQPPFKEAMRVAISKLSSSRIIPCQGKMVDPKQVIVLQSAAVSEAVLAETASQLQTHLNLMRPDSAFMPLLTPSAVRLLGIRVFEGEVAFRLLESLTISRTLATHQTNFDWLIFALSSALQHESFARTNQLAQLAVFPMHDGTFHPLLGDVFDLGETAVSNGKVVDKYAFLQGACVLHPLFCSKVAACSMRNLAEYFSFCGVKKLFLARDGGHSFFERQLPTLLSRIPQENTTALLSGVVYAKQHVSSCTKCRQESSFAKVLSKSGVLILMHCLKGEALRLLPVQQLKPQVVHAHPAYLTGAEAEIGEVFVSGKVSSDDAGWSWSCISDQYLNFEAQLNETSHALPASNAAYGNELETPLTWAEFWAALGVWPVISFRTRQADVRFAAISGSEYNVEQLTASLCLLREASANSTPLDCSEDSKVESSNAALDASKLNVQDSSSADLTALVAYIVSASCTKTARSLFSLLSDQFDALLQHVWIRKTGCGQQTSSGRSAPCTCVFEEPSSVQRLLLSAKWIPVVGDTELWTVPRSDLWLRTKEVDELFTSLPLRSADLPPSVAPLAERLGLQTELRCDRVIHELHRWGTLPTLHASTNSFIKLYKWIQQQLDAHVVLKDSEDPETSASRTTDLQALLISKPCIFIPSCHRQALKSSAATDGFLVGVADCVVEVYHPVQTRFLKFWNQVLAQRLDKDWPLWSLKAIYDKFAHSFMHMGLELAPSVQHYLSMIRVLKRFWTGGPNQGMLREEDVVLHMYESIPYLESDLKRLGSAEVSSMKSDEQDWKAVCRSAFGDEDLLLTQAGTWRSSHQVVFADDHEIRKYALPMEMCVLQGFTKDDGAELFYCNILGVRKTEQLICQRPVFAKEACQTFQMNEHKLMWSIGQMVCLMNQKEAPALLLKVGSGLQLVSTVTLPGCEPRQLGAGPKRNSHYEKATTTAYVNELVIHDRVVLQALVLDILDASMDRKPRRSDQNEIASAIVSASTAASQSEAIEILYEQLRHLGYDISSTSEAPHKLTYCPASVWPVRIGDEQDKVVRPTLPNDEPRAPADGDLSIDQTLPHSFQTDTESKVDALAAQLMIDRVSAQQQARIASLKAAGVPRPAPSFIGSSTPSETPHGRLVNSACGIPLTSAAADDASLSRRQFVSVALASSSQSFTSVPLL